MGSLNSQSVVLPGLIAVHFSIHSELGRLILVPHNGEFFLFMLVFYRDTSRVVRKQLGTETAAQWILAGLQSVAAAGFTPA